MSEVDRKFRVFSADDVRKALPIARAVEAMKEAFRELSAGGAVVPLRTHMTLADYDADVLIMSCFSPRLSQVGLKIITLHPHNMEKGLPFIQATVMVVDAEHGTPLALMNGAALTALRTGAASGAATDVLARSDSATVAIFGSGVQAVTQLEAVCAVRDIKYVSVFDVDNGRAKKFAESMKKALNIEVVAQSTPSAALAGADIVCTATTSGEPVFDDADVAPGTHINAIGVYKPHKREIPAATVARARVVVDERAAAWEEAGELILARSEGLINDSHIHAEVGEILSGKLKGRGSDEEITLFKSVGIATQDLSAAHVVLEQGIRMGLGSVVSL